MERAEGVIPLTATGGTASPTPLKDTPSQKSFNQNRGVETSTLVEAWAERALQIPGRQRNKTWSLGGKSFAYVLSPSPSLA
ncbi:hypothetical protein EYF80_050363 [Liparis tanakae]|uniref:Uncharacterized protein n=1 Tax=Liparis tanakae TaxID=230148 RepID=A0A4Z2FE12_9TELE|nr:hypothetical protein EYF80_050363 [Liparis tanakae]